MSRFENCSTHDISLRLDADFGLARFCSKPTAPSAQITRRSRTVVRGVPSKQRTFRYNPRAGCLSSYESLWTTPIVERVPVRTLQHHSPTYRAREDAPFAEPQHRRGHRLQDLCEHCERHETGDHPVLRGGRWQLDGREVFDEARLQVSLDPERRLHFGNEDEADGEPDNEADDESKSGDGLSLESMLKKRFVAKGRPHLALECRGLVIWTARQHAENCSITKTMAIGMCWDTHSCWPS